MRMRYGNVFNVFNPNREVLFVTTNSVVRTTPHTALVMGAGIADVVRKVHPQLPEEWGTVILNTVGSGGVYGIIEPAYESVAPSIGAFQTKTQPHLDSRLDLIEIATDALIKYASMRPSTGIVHLNAPGIGMGKLEWHDVEPIIRRLPDVVTVWTLERLPEARYNMR